MKQSLTLLVLLCCAFTVCAKATPQIHTVYAKGQFLTTCSVPVECNKATCEATVEDFIDQFVGNPNQLFDWALKGMGKSNDDSKNEVLLSLKEAYFDRATGKSRLVLDIEVANVMTMKNQVVESKISRWTDKEGNYVVFVDIYYSNSLLKKASGKFIVKPISPNRSELSIQVGIRFGWFFNIFITQNRYRNMFEWRCQGFMNNMRHEMEQRCGHLVKK